jgi:hypothetical protein
MVPVTWSPAGIVVLHYFGHTLTAAAGGGNPSPE